MYNLTIEAMKKGKSKIRNLQSKMIAAVGIGAESPECVGTSADGLVADSPVARLATAALKQMNN
jgi:hypothetical protein